MRRFVSIATLALLLLCPAWAQMRGGRISQSAASGRARVAINRPVERGFFGPRFTNSKFGVRFRFRHHRNPHFFCPGFRFCGSGDRFGYGYLGAYWDYPLDYASDYQQSSNQNQQLEAYELGVMNSQQQQIERRLESLEERLDRLREHKATPPAQAAAPEKGELPRPAVLVYRDGHTQEVQNYAIVGQTLWVLNEQQAKKIPFSMLDLKATRKANQDRNVDFELPDESG